MPGGSTIEFPSPESDELVAQAIGGDPDAFAELFKLTHVSVFRYLYARCGDAALAEDITQDAYIRAMRAIKRSFKGRSNDFLAWVIRIARNRFLDHVKSGRVRWEVVVDDMPVTLARNSPEDDALASVESEELKRALEQLTDEQQEIVLMRFFHGLPIAEVAASTGRTEGAVKALQFRALRALGKVLELEGFEVDR